MECVGSGLGHVGDLGAGQLAILAGVCVGDDRGFLNLVGADGQVGRTGVIDVEIRIHVVLAVDREQVRGRRQAIHGEVSVATGVVHLGARRCLGDVGNVAAGIGQQRYLLLRIASTDAGAAGVYNRRGTRYFDSGRRSRHGQRNVPRRCLSKRDVGQNLHRSKATLLHRLVTAV